ncbi:Protein CBG15567 [Caenorhabditis briggsae]|nr:Protein CBG15567 [Caenorhabditis briggsae]CAP33723.2 Protein CBG15567 [Caenorhabditis briggsae]
MAIYIIHNNEYHDGYTCEQLGHLIRIMRARTSLLDHKYDSDSIIKKTEQIIEKYNYQKRLKNDTLYQYERAALAKPPIGPTKQVEELPKIQNVSDPVAFLGIAEMVGIGSSTPKSDKIKKKVGPKDDSKDAPKILLPEILIEQLSPPTSPQSKT